MNLAEIKKIIPHREPFLWLDKVVLLEDDFLRAEKFLPSDLPVFTGHYPNYPIMPGVLLCEAVFQAGALLLSQSLQGEAEGVPVLARIKGAKFKREVRPGDTVVIEVHLLEKLGSAWFMKGSVFVGNKVAVQVSFSCALSLAK